MLCTLGVRVCDVCVYDKCVYDIRVSRRVGICNVLRRVCDVRVFDVRVYDAQRLTAVYMDRIPNIIFNPRHNDFKHKKFNSRESSKTIVVLEGFFCSVGK